MDNAPPTASIPSIEATMDVDEPEIMEAAARSPAVVKQEPMDVDQVYPDPAPAVIKREDSFSAIHSPGVSTPTASTPNGYMRSLHTPNHREGSRSPSKAPESAYPPNSATRQEPPTAQSLIPSTDIQPPTPPSIPTTAFRTRVMVFEQLLPALYPGHRGCCHPTVDISEVQKREVPHPSNVGTSQGDSATKGSGSGRRIVEDDNYDVDTNPSGAGQSENPLNTSSACDASSKPQVSSKSMYAPRTRTHFDMMR